MPASYETLEIISSNLGVQFTVKVVPGASRDQIVGTLGSALKVAVSAPPEGGKANAAMTKLLAGILGINKTAIQIVAGHSQPLKRIAVAGVSPETVLKRLADA